MLRQKEIKVRKEKQVQMETMRLEQKDKRVKHLQFKVLQVIKDKRVK